MELARKTRRRIVAVGLIGGTGADPGASDWR